MVIQGKKVYLKKGLSNKEYSALLKWFNDIEIVKYLSFAKKALKFKTIKEVKSFGNGLTGTIYFAVYTKKTNKLIGYAFLAEFENHENPTTLDYRPEFARPSGSGRIFRMPKIENSFIERETLDFTSFHPEFSIFVHKQCEFGIAIGDKTYWGKGIGSEITNLIIEYAFHKLGLEKVYLTTSEYNKRAINLYSKTGFKLIRKIPKDREVYHNNKWVKSATVCMEIRKQDYTK